MAEEFVGMTIAVTVVVASILLAGILIGVGRAFSYKRIEYFGVEELAQSIINAAIIGSFAAIISLVGAVSASLVTTECAEGTVVEQLICLFEAMNAQLFILFQELTKMLNILGYYQSLSLNFGAFVIEPFANLSSLSNIFSSQLLLLNALMILAGLNTQIALFIKENALVLIFPVGLVLRTLFATRKAGGFLIALALGLYLFYPAFVLVFPSPQPAINESVVALQQFNNNSYYAPVPVVDLNDNYALGGKIDVMSGRCAYANLSNTSACLNLTEGVTADFTSDVTLIAQKSSDTMSKVLLYAAIAPLFSLIITAVFIRELGSLLGSDIGIKTMAAV